MSVRRCGRSRRWPKAMGAERQARCRKTCRGFRSTAAPSGRARRSSRSRTRRDGHDFVEAALKAGGGLAVVAAAKRDMFPKDAPLLVVPDVLDGLSDLARAARARTHAQNHRRHRLGRQDRHQGSAASSRCRATARPMRRPPPTTITGACRCRWRAAAESARYAVFEMGMNHAGEIDAADASWCARMSRSSPRSSRCIWSSSPRSKPSPTPRRKFSQASSRAARRSSTATTRSSRGCKSSREGSRRRRASFRSARTPRPMRG